MIDVCFKLRRVLRTRSTWLLGYIMLRLLAHLTEPELEADFEASAKA